MASKSARKELKQPDEFVNFTNKAIKWALERKFTLLSLSLAILVIAAGFFGFYWYQESTVQTASAALIKAKQILEAEVVEPESQEGDEQQTTQPDVPEGSYASEQDKLKAALAAFQKVSKDFASSKTASLAAYFIGDCYAKLGEAQKAREAFEAYLKDEGLEGELSLYAIEGIGAAYENLGELDKAQQQYMRMTQEPFQQDRMLGLYHLARITQMKGNTKEAAQKFQALLDQFPGSSLTSEIQNRIASLPKIEKTPPPASPVDDGLEDNTKSTHKTDKVSDKNG